MRQTFFLLTMLAMVTVISCDKKRGPDYNPFFHEWETPFGVPPFDEILPRHYMPAFTEAMELHLLQIDSIVSDVLYPSFDNVILRLDNSGTMLGTVSRIFSLVNSADTNDELQALQQEISPMLSSHWDKIYLNGELFNKIKTLYDNRSTEKDSLRLRLIEKTYNNFVRAGAALSESQKEELSNINSALASAQVRFGDNLLAAGRNFAMIVDTLDVESLPRAIKDEAARKAESIGEKGRYAFTLSKTSLLPFLTYSDRPDLRERLYRGYLDQCNYDSPEDNRETVNEIVRLRTRRADLLGYASHADYVLADRMAGSVEAVYSFLDAIWEPALGKAKEELEAMKNIKLSETGVNEFDSWDWWYYAEKVRKANYNLNEEELLPYFSLDQVRNGIFDLSNRLYGVTFRPVKVPVYNKECEAFEVLDYDNSHLGILIMDFYVREGRKRVGAWCGSYRSRTYDNGYKTDPIVTIVCNFPRPAGNKPSLLNLDQTETFFHEFGHALHALFTDVPYRGLIGVERDFVELPSQIMENWALEPSMLRRYAIHYSSGAVIPENLIGKIRETGHFNQGFMTSELLAASFSDMDIHSIEGFESIDVNDFERETLYDRRGLITQIEPRYRFPYFNHIFNGGYSAGYYGYIWAEVLDKDAFEAFIKSGDIYNRKIARAFRKEVLSKGGSADGMTLYRNFRGTDPAREPLMYARGLMERPVPELDDEPLTEIIDSEDIADIDGGAIGNAEN